MDDLSGWGTEAALVAGVVSEWRPRTRPPLGAPIVHELTDQTDYPSRDFTVADSDGNHWTFATFAG